MRNGKVFIATYGFPPYLKSLGGSIRILKLAEYLHEQGFDVTVVCARTRHFDTYGYDETLAKIKTIACDDPVATMSSRLHHVLRHRDRVRGEPVGGRRGRVQRRVGTQ